MSSVLEAGEKRGGGLINPDAPPLCKGAAAMDWEGAEKINRHCTARQHAENQARGEGSEEGTCTDIDAAGRARGQVHKILDKSCAIHVRSGGTTRAMRGTTGEGHEKRGVDLIPPKALVVCRLTVGGHSCLPLR